MITKDTSLPWFDPAVAVVHRSADEGGEIIAEGTLRDVIARVRHLKYAERARVRVSLPDRATPPLSIRGRDLEVAIAALNF